MGIYLVHRTDGNQKEIVAALEKAGALVYKIGGLLDLAVGYRGRVFLFECKAGPDAPMTKNQKAFFAVWWPAGYVHRIDSPEQALEIIGAVPKTKEQLVRELRQSLVDDAIDGAINEHSKLPGSSDMDQAANDTHSASQTPVL